MKKVFWGCGSVVLGCVLLVAGYTVFRPKPPAPPDRVETIGDIETYLSELVAFGAPPGLTLLVVKDGTTRYNHGFGLADAPENVTAASDTVYKWWSMTKVFTAVAILQLHEQGRLHIDHPVVDYLPFFDVHYVSDDDPVATIRHVLNHSAGIPDNVPEVMGWMHLEHETRPDQTDFLESVFPDYAHLEFTPGERSEYSNVGYMVLGAIVESVAGSTYEDYIVDNVLLPLGMHRTNFFYTPEMSPVAATGSHPLLSWQTPFLPFLFDDWKAFIRETVDQRMWFNRFYADSNPPTGLMGPTGDLALFLLAFLEGGQHDGRRILSAETVALMTTQSIIPVGDTGQTDADFQGLGWEAHREGDTVEFLAHGGGGPGFGCGMRLYPHRGLGVAVLANDTTYDRAAILDLVAQLEW